MKANAQFLFENKNTRGNKQIQKWNVSTYKRKTKMLNNVLLKVFYFQVRESPAPPSTYRLPPLHPTNGAWNWNIWSLDLLFGKPWESTLANWRVVGPIQRHLGIYQERPWILELNFLWFWKVVGGGMISMFWGSCKTVNFQACLWKIKTINCIPRPPTKHQKIVTG